MKTSHFLCLGLRRYGWLRHDGRTFGEQELLDAHLNITTSMVSVAFHKQL